MNKTCSICQKLFQTDHNDSKYCSTTCQYRALSQRNRERSEVKCQQCGTPFYPRSGARGKFCSFNCLRLYEQAHQPGKIIKCIHCDKEVYRQPSYSPNAKKTFCSYICQQDYYKQFNVLIVCSNCGKKTYKCPSELAASPNAKNRFCSFKCLRDWNHKHRSPLSASERGKITYRRQKEIVFNHYGHGNLRCECCGVSDARFLTLDHIHGGGAKHRKKITQRYWKWFIDNNFPSGFKILCMNCNFATGHFKTCPHKEEINRDISYSAKSDRKLKRVVMEHYGGKCVHCKESQIEFLTIDHIKGRRDGSRLTGRNLYRYLRDHGYPKGIQVLCFNCNWAKK